MDIFAKIPDTEFPFDNQCGVSPIDKETYRDFLNEL